jgi:5-methylcytosine-specific restriction endonuclease McrA
MKLPSGTTARAVEEWMGKTPDSVIPDYVKVRVFNRFGGKCGLTGKKLSAGEYDIDHRTPLKDEGENRESNLWPIWKPKHKEKTADENSERAKVLRLQKKQLPRPPSKMQSRGFRRHQSNTKYVGDI